MRWTEGEDCFLGPRPAMERDLKMRQRKLGLWSLWVLAAVLMSQVTNASGARLGGGNFTFGSKLQGNQIVMIHQAAVLCRQQPGNYRVRLQGLFVLQMSPALVHRQGALFDADELPSSAVDNVRKYGGIAVKIPAVVYQKRGSPRASAWIRAQGLLECRYPRVELYAWRQVRPGASGQSPTLQQIFTPQSAHRFCMSHREARVRITVHGYYIARTGVYVTGALYEDQTAKGTDSSNGLSVVTSIKYHSTTVIPSSAVVSLHGLLDCSARPYQFEAYGWQR